MCARCFDQKMYGFLTEAAFAALRAILAQKASSGQLLAMGPPSPKPPVAYDADTCYECWSCSAFWLLATPDNAWRGFFLPANDAIAYQQRLHRRDKRSRVAGLVAATLLGLAIWCFTC
jgi:hypothetical protein